MQHMDFNTRINRKILIDWFPNLAKDTVFKLTSPDTPVYNCIAWAMGFTDRWVDHFSAAGHWWPQSVEKDDTCQSLLNAFLALGFEPTDNYNYNASYDKVVLYGYDGKWKHASRILVNNIEHSKFGALWDGIHGHNVFQDDIYGIAYACVQRPIDSFDPKQHPLAGRIKILKKPIW